MFQGTLPPPVLATFAPLVRSWGCTDLGFPCSGKFTVPRALVDCGARLHGNDVTLYSCALGAFYADDPVEVTDREGMGLEWLRPYMGSLVDRTATVLVWSDFAEAWCKRDQNPYFRRMAAATRAQFATLHEKAVAKLAASHLRLASFHAGDCLEFLERLPADTGVIGFPPVYAGGYEKMWKHLDQCLTWTPPDYPLWAKESWERYLALTDRFDKWITVVQDQKFAPALKDRLFAVVQSTNRSTRFRVYASEGATRRLVQPHQRTEPALTPRLGEHEELAGELALTPLTAPVFAALRSQYLNPLIAPAGAQVMMGVHAGTRLIGCLAFTKSDLAMAGAAQPSVYMMTDFPVQPTRYPRLSKLVAACALSRECQLLVERTYGRRLRSVVTTAFSNKPVSMKYRGVFQLLSRNECPDDPDHKYKINYGADLGQRTLAETLAWWRDREKQTA